MSLVEERLSFTNTETTTRSSIVSSTSGAQSPPTKDYQLDQFGRHIPCVLASQLIDKLLDQFITQDGENELDQVGAFSCTPSITRFDAALLFVDISGFTILSQRLPVDELRQCINNYFTIILDTIQSYDGDVVKFAGDALFVIWRMEIKDPSPEAQRQGLSLATVKAIKCGIEINRLCTNYRVDFKPKEGTDQEQIISSLVLRDNNTKSLSEATPAAVPTATTTEADHTFLNVHSGCAAGRFAGIDVGAVDRWEYLIVGQPLQDVADAEAMAGKGELVVSPTVHGLMCTASLALETPPILNPGETLMPCGCIQSANGLSFRINHARTVEIVQQPQVSDSDNNNEDYDELSKDDYEFAFYRRVVSHTYKAFNVNKERIMDRFYSFLHPPGSHNSPRASQRLDSSSKKALSVSSSTPVLPVTTAVTPPRSPEAEKFVFHYFLKWLMSCLTSDFARHVHEADRLDFKMSKMSRINCLEDCAKEFLAVVATGLPVLSLPDPTNSNSEGDDLMMVVPSKKRDSTATASFVRRIRGLVNPNHSENNHNRSSVSSNSTNSNTTKSSIQSTHHNNSNSNTSNNSSSNNYLREKHQKKHEKLLKKDRDLIGELRNVIVLFIAIKSEMKSLWIDPDSDTNTDKPLVCEKLENVDSAFHFLQPTSLESEADQKLLQHYQTCMSLIVTSLREKGGQLRQFIVDDKGTVAIGSFGLRGSANYDNAAAAVEAALDIILHLQNVGLDCSIGITSGRVYCGVVGSLRRHEYAVMGPSVNLSARLMGQARAGEIICDVSTRAVDRIHTYRPLGEVKAKGYTELVPIFKPVFNRGSVIHFGAAGSGSLVPSIERIASLESPRPDEREREHPHHSLAISTSTPVTPTTPARSSNANTAIQYINSKTRTGASPRLIGRYQEEFQVIHMILSDIAEESTNGVDLSELTKAVQTGATSTTPVELKIDTGCKARLAVIHGTSGIGKSALIASVCDKLFRYSRQAAWSLQLVHGKSSSLTMSDPLKPWHVIIRTILSQFARYYNIVAATREEPAVESLELSDRSLLTKKWQQGLEYLSSFISESDKKLFPLLTTARIVPGLTENEVTSKLSGPEKLEHTVRICQVIVQQYPILTNKVLLVILDDAHFMDAHSWRLVQKLLEASTGVIFLAGYYNAADESTNPHPTASTHQTESEMKVSAALTTTTTVSQTRHAIHEEVITCHCQSRRIVLGALSKEAIRDMASHVFGGLNLQTIPPSLGDTFEEMSGGNPLYVYEIGLAMLERLKAWAAEQHRSLSELLSDPALLGSYERLLKEFRANRIDEVIYYRFDRLDGLSQLVLKLGAVATISHSQRGFTLEMLLHLLLQKEEEEELQASFDEDQRGDGNIPSLRALFSSTTLEGQNKYQLAARKLAAVLREMVDHHQFIRIIRTRRRSSFQDPLAVTAMEATNTTTAADITESKDLLEGQEDEDLIIRTASQKLNHRSKDSANQRFQQELVEVCYDFSISLERKTIYELMLADQKESLHDRIATYLERENQENITPGKYLTFADLAEEGYHWEKATVWGQAMTCYFKAASLLESQGAFAESYQYLGLAYRMFALLKKDAKVSEASEHHSLSFEVLMQELTVSHLSPPQLLEGKQQTSDFALSRIDVFNTFGGDPQLLGVAIQLLVKLGQTSFTLGEKVAVTAKIYEEALRLILLTWPREVSTTTTPIRQLSASGSSSRDLEDPNSPLPPSRMKRSFRSNTIQRRQRLTDVQSTNQHFQLTDPSSCFPIVAGMAALYRTRRLPDDTEHSKEKCLYQILLNFSLTAPEKYRIHYLQANCLMHSLYTELGDYDAAINLLTEIHHYYTPELYSSDLVQVYGNDRIPFTIALISQYLVLLGYLPQAEEMITFLTNTTLPKMTHLHSLGTLALPLTSIHLLRQNQEQANHCFFHYRKVELSRSGSFSFFQEFNALCADYLQVRDLYLQRDYQTLYRLLTTCERPTTTKKSTETETKTTKQPDLACGHLFDMIEKILQRKYLLRSDRPLVFDAIMSFGLAIEYLCADLLLMIVESLIVRQSYGIYMPMELLSLAVEYCDVALEITKVNHRFMMVYVLLTLTKCRVFLLLLCCPKSSDEEKQMAVERLQETLTGFIEVVDREKLDLVRVLLIQLLQGHAAERYLSSDWLGQLFAGFCSDSVEETKGEWTLQTLVTAAMNRLKEKNRSFYVNEKFAGFHEIFKEEIPSTDRLKELLSGIFNQMLSTPTATVCSVKIEEVP